MAVNRGAAERSMDRCVPHQTIDANCINARITRYRIELLALGVISSRKISPCSFLRCCEPHPEQLLHFSSAVWGRVDQSHLSHSLLDRYRLAPRMAIKIRAVASQLP